MANYELMVARPKELQNGHLYKLNRLLKLRKEHSLEINEQGLHLMDKTIFTSYVDSVEAGALSQARAALEKYLPADKLKTIIDTQLEPARTKQPQTIASRIQDGLKY